ncbi:N-acetylmuramoyl-L-alanine amidase [Streptomyces sp. NPDC088337]|uniref:N-acetylmuramoyl-L-alanine amidase n=1 Tax=unclassified Streptomyces TaxID=2593676 RepID=UPI002DDA493E|nr:N-acetylmuramoyl-L-alanine amidase [Streptomyces sp. NBC_01788]WSB28852.1 N-acetylmuramoyl-L-alanine amidase [Streptomyces sp. NBC_01788]
MGRPRYIWGTAAVATAGIVGGLLLTTGSDQPGKGTDGDGKPGPVTSQARTAALTASEQGTSAALKQERTEPFSMLGITWNDPSARVDGTIEARTRAAGSGQWSQWLRLDGSGGQGEASAERGGTEPAWVGPSDGVEVRVTAGGRTSDRLPAGLRLDMIDPGRAATGGTGAMEPAAYAVDAPDDPSESPDPTAGQPADTPPEETPAGDDPTTEPVESGTPAESTPPSQAPSSSAPASPPPSTTPSPSPSPSATGPKAPPSTAPRPAIVSRAGWGADETLSPEAPDYLPGGKIKAVVVHHTAESNNYTCAEAPAIVRGIYAYHVKQLKWKDLGYNFLVDKCGTVYEGRKGGVDLPVMGAHAYGFNSETTGISVLGTYTDVAPSDAALTSVARIAAWKLGQYGVDPAGTATLTAGDSGSNYARKTWAKGAKLSLPAIHGHRDGFNTQCPGNAYYAKLPTVRAWAAGPVTGLAIKSVTGAGLSGATYYTQGAITVGWTATTPSALIGAYEILVDGQPVTKAAGTATSAKATLTPGSHQVQVRATHQSGRTAVSAAATVVAETTAPTFPTKPALALRAGTVNTTAVPVTLSWKAADNTALKEVRLTAPAAATYGPTATSAALTATSGAATTWSLTAYDQAGNTGTAAVSGTPVLVQETAATKTGTWAGKSSASYLGGQSFGSSTKNASLTWAFTGRSVAWLVSRASTSGQADIYIDGTKAARVDLQSATTKYRDAIWTKTWPTSAKHTIKIVVVGTAGRPAVTTDGIVYLK